MLKQYATTTKAALDERGPYWKDFDEISDPRHTLSRNLGAQLAAQWLSPEVVSHLEDLIEWEISRSAGNTEVSLPNAQVTESISLEQWAVVRDGLSDLWDWWGEGVHLRPQPTMSEREVATFDRPPYAQVLINRAMPMDVPSGTAPEPMRLLVADAHLGDALFRLTAWVHFFVARADGWLGKDNQRLARELWADRRAARRCQVRVVDGQYTLFAPSGRSTEYWSAYVSRINAAGWRPEREFPDGCNIVGIDLTGTLLTMFGRGSWVRIAYSNLSHCDGGGCSLGGSDLDTVLLDGITLAMADLQGSAIDKCDGANLSFVQATMKRARLRDCRFENVDFEGASLLGVTISGSYLTEPDFSHAALQGAEITECVMKTARFEATLLNHTTFNDVTFTGTEALAVFVDAKTKLPEELAGNAIVWTEVPLD